MLYILYYPGKDNDQPISLTSRVLPLSVIMNAANPDLQMQYTQKELADAKKIFVVAESNKYFLVQVQHYIKADVTHGVLTTDDSIDRDYDESYLDKHIAHDQRFAIKRGWQNMVLDHWSCGHHALDRIRTDILGLVTPEEFEVNSAIIKQHFEYYLLGSASFNNKKHKLHSSSPMLSDSAESSERSSE
jgi:hypothetical protein